MQLDGTRAVLLVLVTALLAVCGQAAPPPDSIVGRWQGTLAIGPDAKLRVIFNIQTKAKGGLQATLDSPDQGATGIPVDTVAFTNRTLRLAIKAIVGSYEGTLSKDNKTLAGTWTQSGNALPLVMTRTAKTAAAARRPQEPAKPYPYDEEEVTYPGGAADITLAGTLTRPRNGGPFPVVLLITGSGPQNRDEALLGHKPFLVLADYLTRRGIAVLRVDDRGVGGSTGAFARATTLDFAGDVLAGVAYLKSRADVDKTKIGLIGHSEGGLIAPLAATRSGDIALVVLLAGPGLPGEEILYQQGALIAKATGATDQAIAENRAVQERMFAVVKTEKDTAAAEKKLRAVLAKKPGPNKPGAKAAKASGTSDSVADAQIQMVNTPWFRYFLTYDPRPALTQIRCPVFALFGEKDLQVPAKENAAAIETALKTASHPDHTVQILPNLNHLFQTSKTGSPLEYARIEETIAPEALQAVGDWITQRVTRR